MQGRLGTRQEISREHDRRAADEAFYRDIKIGEICEGANEVQKWVIARQIFGRDITG